MTDTRFPVASFAEATPYLRAPYTPELVYGRVVSAPDNTAAPCEIALYVSSETVMSRLNIVCDVNWEVDFKTVAERPSTRGEKTLYYMKLRAHVTVFGRTFEDLGDATSDGEAMAEYMARAQSFKRAARWFGVGHCLYSAGKIVMWRGPGETQLSIPKSGKDPHKRPYLDEDSERYIRQQYEKWLERTGERIYGEPLDHLKAAPGRIAIVEPSPAPAPAPDEEQTTSAGQENSPPTAQDQQRALPNGQPLTATFRASTPPAAANDTPDGPQTAEPPLPALEELAQTITRHDYQQDVVHRLIALSQGQGSERQIAWEGLPEQKIREITGLLGCAAQLGWDNARLGLMVMRAHNSAHQNTPAGRYAAFANHLTNSAEARAAETARSAA